MTEKKHPREQYLVHIELLTLAAGTASFENPFAGGDVLGVAITQKGGTALTESFAWSISGNNIVIDSDNGTSTATVTVIVYGRY
jgi:hypothetical protein